MAIMMTIVCTRCKQVVQESRPSGYHGHKCHECEAKEAEDKEAVWKAMRDTMSMEERLRELENFMYHHGKHYQPSLFG